MRKLVLLLGTIVLVFASAFTANAATIETFSSASAFSVSSSDLLQTDLSSTIVSPSSLYGTPYYGSYYGLPAWGAEPVLRDGQNTTFLPDLDHYGNTSLNNAETALIFLDVSIVYELDTGNNSLGSDVLPPRAEQAEHWTIAASHVQVEVPRHELTHDRKLPLPCRIDAFINGKLYPQAPYLGHGLSKVVYRLTEQRVLKLCDLDDQEPGLFQDLHASGVYPTVHAKNQCQQLHSPGWPARTWNAWVMDYAMPLDKILKTSPALSNVCIIGAIHAMLTAYSRGHIMSDNDFCNFGMVGATSPCSRKVVIIDAGSRAFRAPISKGDFNETVMSKFWKHVEKRLIEQPEELKEQRQRWSSSGWVINDALQKYEECLQNLRHESNSTLQISRVDEVAETACRGKDFGCWLWPWLHVTRSRPCRWRTWSRGRDRSE